MTKLLHVRLRPAVLVPLGLFALALLLRVIGANWHGTHFDEDIGGPARLLSGDFYPRTFYYPPLLTYLVAIAYVPLYGLGRLLGWWHSTASFRAAYFDQPVSFYVTARVVVALCSASAAPIAWALARQVGLSGRAALLAGLAAAVLPGAVYWSHIAKSDSGIGPAFLLVGLCTLRLLDRPSSLWRAVQVGVAAAVAVSFKQSAVFFLAPVLALFVLWSMRAPGRRRIFAGSWIVALLAAAVAGAILNIGILLDPKPFIEAQVVQSQMSYRAASLDVRIGTWISQLLSDATGLPLVTLLGAAALWVLGIACGGPRIRLLLTICAIGWVTGTIVICSITGSRQPSQLWLPYLVLGFVAAAIGAGLLTDARERPLRLVGYAGFCLLFASSIIRIAPILTQATAPAIGAPVAAIVRSDLPPGARLVSNVDLTGYLPLSPQSQILTRVRHERLAARYGIHLPPQDRPFAGTPGGYTVVDYPWVIGGLEKYSGDEVKVVIPYAWPIQPEEWQLDHWLAQDFHVFVIGGVSDFVNDPVPAYRAFFRALDRCPRIATVPAARPLFGEQDTGIYRCAGLNQAGIRGGSTF
ncbi:phospholipid carrier-dependent glycosyltransferase [Methylobacterium platani]|uniref:ArnT-like N-terminal domain-containing protein n=2 Tax=Methylobacterium platani TaxID=427683 RepID=A0A179RXE2_9HYPH|nr:glycosyltransferase family 39 protein [Methylobacterium platani]KMO13857.1 hypothetical protein SQ03_20955 [Methylobacterium platani JCM 14648]OAS14640.1 hypothetical protein A5481_30210 [Methylobacterium platani]